MRKDKGRVPAPLAYVLSVLRDGGTDSALRLTKGGYPYAVFLNPAGGGTVSLQYRAPVQNRRTGEEKPSRFVVFLPTDTPGTQEKVRHYSVSSLLAFLGFSEDAVEAMRRTYPDRPDGVGHGDMVAGAGLEPALHGYEP